MNICVGKQKYSYSFNEDSKSPAFSEIPDAPPLCGLRN